MSFPQDLFEKAKEARLRSYSPYSKHQVGAALRTSDGHIYPGCNVENSSYGGTNCAERVAVQNAVASQGKVRITEIVIVTDAQPAWPPCGICRQVMAEFAGPELKIHMVNIAGQVVSSTLKELLPLAFSLHDTGSPA